MSFKHAFKKVIVLFAFLSALATSTVPVFAAANGNTDKTPSLISLDELQNTVNHLKANKKTCNLDFLNMLGEAISNYVNRQDLTEKEGVALLVKVSAHENACKKVKW